MMAMDRSALGIVIGLEARKVARATVTRVATIAALTLVTVTTAGGYAAAMHAGDTDMGRKAASMVTSPGWDGYTGLGATSVSATILLAVGVVMSWSVGREFTDGTIVGLFAIPPAPPPTPGQCCLRPGPPPGRRRRRLSRGLRLRGRRVPRARSCR